MKFTEAELEKAIIDLLHSQGYPHITGESITRPPQDVLIKEDLRQFLSNKYKADNLSNSEIDSIIRKLESLPASDLYDSNKSIMKWVSDGFSFQREDRSQKDLYIQEVGRIYSVTRERIRQIEAKALEKLRHPNRSQRLRKFL